MVKALALWYVCDFFTGAQLYLFGQQWKFVATSFRDVTSMWLLHAATLEHRVYVAAALIKVDIALQAVACGAIALSCVHFG